MPVTDVIELHFKDVDGQVRVVPRDSDLMAMSVETAIDACRAFDNQIAFRDQFMVLLDVLGKWISERREKFAEAYVTTRDAGLLFLIVQKAAEYDSELENELTELDLEIANDPDYSRIPLSVLAIPSIDDDSTRSFLPKAGVFKYDVDGD